MRDGNVEVSSCTIRPDLNDRDGAASLRRIKPEPMAAFHDLFPETRHSASGQLRALRLTQCMSDLGQKAVL